MRPAAAVTAVTVILVGASAVTAYTVLIPEAVDPGSLTAHDGYLTVPKEACRDGPNLPDEVPGRFVVHLIPLEDQRMHSSVVAELQDKVNHAYWFLDIEVTPTLPADLTQTQVIPAYVTINNQLVSPKGRPALGLECHNQIFLMHREGRSGVITSTIIHEVGHVLGLTHEDNTWMHAQGTSWGIPQHAQRWNMDQFDYLLLWADVGLRIPEPYQA